VLALLKVHFKDQQTQAFRLHLLQFQPCKMLSEKFKSMVKSAVEGYHDPWADKHIDKLPAEKVTRHRYIPSKR
jgi:hypothetical protein